MDEKGETQRAEVNVPRSHCESVERGLNPGTCTRLYTLQQASNGVREEMPFKYRITRKHRCFSPSKPVPCPHFSGHQWSALDLCCHMNGPLKTRLLLGGAVCPALSANLSTISKPELHSLPLWTENEAERWLSCCLSPTTCPPLPTQPPSSAHLCHHTYFCFSPTN